MSNLEEKIRKIEADLAEVKQEIDRGGDITEAGVYLVVGPVPNKKRLVVVAPPGLDATHRVGFYANGSLYWCPVGVEPYKERILRKFSPGQYSKIIEYAETLVEED